MSDPAVSLQDLERCLAMAQRFGRAELQGLPRTVAEDVADWLQAHHHRCEITCHEGLGFRVAVLAADQGQRSSRRVPLTVASGNSPGSRHDPRQRTAGPTPGNRPISKADPQCGTARRVRWKL
jgi:hypothetical protein